MNAKGFYIHVARSEIQLFYKNITPKNAIINFEKRSIYCVLMFYTQTARATHSSC